MPINTVHWAPRKRSKADQDVRAVSSFSPFYLCFVSCDVLQRESRPHGPPLSLSTGRRCFFLLPCSTPSSPSLSWAWIFVSALGNLPPSNSVRRGACFVLSLSCQCLRIPNLSFLPRLPITDARATSRRSAIHPSMTDAAVISRLPFPFHFLSLERYHIFRPTKHDDALHSCSCPPTRYSILLVSKLHDAAVNQTNNLIF